MGTNESKLKVNGENAIDKERTKSSEEPEVKAEPDDDYEMRPRQSKARPSVPTEAAVRVDGRNEVKVEEPDDYDNQIEQSVQTLARRRDVVKVEEPDDYEERISMTKDRELSAESTGEGGETEVDCSRDSNINVEEIELATEPNEDRNTPDIVKFQLLSPNRQSTIEFAMEKGKKNIVEDLHFHISHIFSLKKGLQQTFERGESGAFWRDLRWEDAGECKKMVEKINGIVRCACARPIKRAARPTDSNWFAASECTADQAKELASRAFSRSVANASVLNKCYKGFSSCTYGETSYDQLQLILDRLEMKEEDVFVDLGSGVGNLVTFASAYTKAKCVGIEINDVPAQFADKIKKEFANLMEWYSKTSGPFELIHDSFLNEKYHKMIIEEATVIFINNFAFVPQLMLELKDMLKEIWRNGVRIVVTKSLSEERGEEIRVNRRTMSRQSLDMILDVVELPMVKDAVSWSEGRNVKFLMYTTNQNKFERIYNEMKQKEDEEEAKKSHRIPRRSSGNNLVSRKKIDKKDSVQANEKEDETLNKQIGRDKRVAEKAIPSSSISRPSASTGKGRSGEKNETKEVRKSEMKKNENVTKKKSNETPSIHAVQKAILSSSMPRSSASSSKVLSRTKSVAKGVRKSERKKNEKDAKNVTKKKSNQTQAIRSIGSVKRGVQKTIQSSSIARKETKKEKERKATIPDNVKSVVQKVVPSSSISHRSAPTGKSVGSHKKIEKKEKKKEMKKEVTKKIEKEMKSEEKVVRKAPKRRLNTEEGEKENEGKRRRVQTSLPEKEGRKEETKKQSDKISIAKPAKGYVRVLAPHFSIFDQNESLPAKRLRKSVHANLKF